MMFERFTDRARRVVVLAQEEARRLNHNYIGTEHLLLGLVHEGDGVAAQALERLGIALPAVRGQVEEIIGRGLQRPTGHIPFTPRSKKVLELSLREALALGHNYIGTEHILLGLVREGEGVAAQALERLGAEMSSVRAEVIEVLSELVGPDPGAEEPVGPRQGWQEAGWQLLASGSETTWRALALARRGAAADERAVVEVSDLANGVLGAGDPRVSDALAAAGAAVGAPAEPQPDEGEPPGLPLSTNARRACAEALSFAGNGASLLRPTHLLLGCLTVLEAEEAATLRERLGVAPEEVLRILADAESRETGA